MHRIFLALFTMLALFAGTSESAVAAPQSPDNLAGSKTTALSYVEDATNATVTLIPAVTAQSITLYRIILSSSGTDNFYLKCGTTQKTAKVYLGANSGLDTMIFPMYLRCDAGEALSLVKGTATTPVGVTLWFNQER
ncbi:MAG TPA: hypothetical protein V6C52_12375 [Coleofasciculaceae cyanobacterium]|jgi:hypothetical protein